ncbi:mitochondrial division protein 1 [Pseudohyphozyma bogoriensis]|nr:mitochondrial division protein 1 [Pseudohyphozyma bogoriensis]
MGRVHSAMSRRDVRTLQDTVSKLVDQVGLLSGQLADLQRQAAPATAPEHEDEDEHEHEDEDEHEHEHEHRHEHRQVTSKGERGTRMDRLEASLEALTLSAGHHSNALADSSAALSGALAAQSTTLTTVTNSLITITNSLNNMAKMIEQTADRSATTAADQALLRDTVRQLDDKLNSKLDDTQHQIEILSQHIHTMNSCVCHSPGLSHAGPAPSTPSSHESVTQTPPQSNVPFVHVAGQDQLPVPGDEGEDTEVADE